MSAPVRELLAAVRFLTRLRVPGAPTTAAELPGAVGWFPLIGAAVGAAIGGIAVAAMPWWGAGIAAVLAVTAGLLLTGGFHEDAASDAVDGLGGGGDRAQVLAIMRDSRIGAFGAMALWVVLGLRALLLVRALELLPGWQVPVACALAAAWGRWTAAPLLAWLPPLAEGLAKDIARQAARGPLLLATLLAGGATAAAWWSGLPYVLVAAVVAVLLCAAWGWYLRHRLGGQSGDLLGAGNQLVELGVLLAVLVRPA